jgi:transglutaminase-like putative cysteine protease
MKMSRSASVVTLVLLLGCVSLARGSSNPNLPDWMMQAAAATGTWGDAKAVVLLDDTLLTVGPDGKAVERSRMVVKILRPQGREYAKPIAAFSKDLKLQSFHVWSIGPDGHHYAMKDNEYIEAGDNDPDMVFVDLRAKIASPPGADPGGIVGWEVIEQLPSYETEDGWSFQNSIPVAQGAYEVDLPAGWHQRAEWFHHEAVAPTEVAPGHFRWAMSNVPGVDLDDVPLSPAWEALAGRMSVRFSSNDIPDGDALWANIGNWYYNLEAPQSEGGSDIATAAKSAAGDGDFMARLSKIADFMQQQIRYVGVEIGIGGRQAHPAEQVFQKRYGDCKDKATLMISMLDAVGIRATWVMVDADRGVIDPGTPSEYGNHMIAAIEIPKGYDNPRLQAVVTAKSGRRYLIFDPTNPYVPVGQLPGYEQGGYGLLMDGKDSQVIGFPVLDPDLSKTERTAKFELAPDGTLKGDVTVLRYGVSAWSARYRLAMSSDKEQRAFIEKGLQQDFSSFTLNTETTQNVKQLDQPLKMDYSVTAPLYAKGAGSLLLVRPRVVGSVAEALDDKPRHVPISFPGVGSWHDSFDVKIPAGYAIDDLPDPVNVDVGFATYHSEVKAQGDTLHYTRQYTLKKVTLDPGDYAALHKLEGQITSDENSNAVLKKQ